MLAAGALPLATTMIGTRAVPRCAAIWPTARQSPAKSRLGWILVEAVWGMRRPLELHGTYERGGVVRFVGADRLSMRLRRDSITASIASAQIAAPGLC